MAEAKMKEIRICIPEELFTLFAPADAWTHLRNARREVLLAVRSLIDARIAALDKKQTPSVEKKKIKVE